MTVRIWRVGATTPRRRNERRRSPGRRSCPRYRRSPRHEAELLELLSIEPRSGFWTSSMSIIHRTTGCSTETQLLTTATDGHATHFSPSRFQTISKPDDDRSGNRGASHDAVSRSVQAVARSASREAQRLSAIVEGFAIDFAGDRFPERPRRTPRRADILCFAMRSFAKSFSASEARRSLRDSARKTTNAFVLRSPSSSTLMTAASCTASCFIKHSSTSTGLHQPAAHRCWSADGTREHNSFVVDAKEIVCSHQ